MDVYANFAVQEIAGTAIFRLVPKFGENVRRLRIAAGLKYGYQLAKELEVDPSVVSRWEQNKTGLPETPTLLRLAKVLGVSVDDLLAGVDPDYERVRAARFKERPADDDPKNAERERLARALGLRVLGLWDGPREAVLASIAQFETFQERAREAGAIPSGSGESRAARQAAGRGTRRGR